MLVNYVEIFDGLTSIKFPSAERALAWLASSGHGCQYRLRACTGDVFMNISKGELELMDLYCEF